MLHERALFAVLDIEMSLRLYLTREQWTNYSDLNRRKRKRRCTVTGKIQFKVARISLSIDCIISTCTCYLRFHCIATAHEIWIASEHLPSILFFSLNDGTIFNFLRRTIDPWRSEMSSYVVSRPFLSKTSCPFLRLLS